MFHSFRRGCTFSTGSVAVDRSMPLLPTLAPLVRRGDPLTAADLRGEPFDEMLGARAECVGVLPADGDPYAGE